MESTWSRPIPLSRATWLRVADILFGVVHSGAAAPRRLWRRWQASSRRAAELRALRDLSPGVLRDIGASPQWVSEAQRWHDQHDLTREAFLRGL
jgi:uncharacterized protein YjiS (DUF1127 family)